MTLSAKWTVASFFALTSIAAGSVAFSGCTVTSGNPVNSDSGSPITQPEGDGGGGGDSAVATTKCEGNKQAAGDIVSPACQAKLNTSCCTELKTCFDIVLTADATGTRGTDNCDKYRTCLTTCETSSADGGLDACDSDCVALTQDSVVEAYNAILTCAMKNASDVCK
jgi:hypothetical protein